MMRPRLPSLRLQTADEGSLTGSIRYIMLVQTGG